MAAEKIKVWPSTMLIDDEILWIFHGKLNILLRYDLRKETVRIEGKIPNEENYREILIGAMCKINNYIYLVPTWGKTIQRYDIQTKVFERVFYPEEEVYYGSILFCGLYVIDGKIYCIPSAYPNIIQVDHLSNTVKKIINVHNIFAQYGIDRNAIINDFVYIENKFLCVIEATNKILIFDIRSEVASIITVGNNDDYFYGITEINKKIYLSTWDRHEIVVLENDLKTVSRIANIPFDVFFLSSCGGCLIVDSVYDGQFFILNENGRIIYTQENSIQVNDNFLQYAYHYGITCKSQDLELYFDRHSNELCFFNGKTVIEKRSLYVDKDEVISILQRDNESIMYENLFLELQGLLKHTGGVVSKENEIFYGKNIYESLRK